MNRQTLACEVGPTAAVPDSRLLTLVAHTENERERIGEANLLPKVPHLPPVPVRHDRVVVILVSWNAGYSDLATKAEVDGVRRVFERYYYFEIKEIVLDPGNADLPPHSQLRRDVEEIMHTTSRRTLLIMYYTGHGSLVGSGALYLGGKESIAPEQTDRETIEWRIIEKSLDSPLVEVLAMFDCCYAGALRDFNKSICHSPCFEFLCASRERAPKPGKGSFTAALIKALYKLRGEDGFSSTVLERTVKEFASSESPHVDPLLFSRQKTESGLIWIAPLMPESIGRSTVSIDEQVLLHVEQKSEDIETPVL